MPWKGVAVTEERQRFLEEHRLNYYSISELAERFEISRKTAHKWINRFEDHGQDGYQEQSRRPQSCPWQREPAIAQELVEPREAHPHWGPRKLLNLMHQRHREWELPAPSTAALILARQGLVRSRRRYRRAHPGVRRPFPRGRTISGRRSTRGSFG